MRVYIVYTRIHGFIFRHHTHALPMPGTGTGAHFVVSQKLADRLYEICRVSIKLRVFAPGFRRRNIAPSKRRRLKCPAGWQMPYTNTRRPVLMPDDFLSLSRED